ADLEEGIETQVEVAHTEAVSIAGYIKEHIIPQVVTALEREEKKEAIKAPVVPSPVQAPNVSTQAVPVPATGLPLRTTSPILPPVAPRAFSAIRAVHTQFTPPPASPTRESRIPVPPKPPAPPVEENKSASQVISVPHVEATLPTKPTSPISAPIPQTPKQSPLEKPQVTTGTTPRLDPYREQI
ncbi:MAG: hypothetical protein ACKOW9_02950, partial [Candidatus Paceibacterota bacterium]